MPDEEKPRREVEGGGTPSSDEESGRSSRTGTADAFKPETGVDEQQRFEWEHMTPREKATSCVSVIIFAVIAAYVIRWLFY